MYNTMAPLSMTHHSVHIHGHAFQVVAMGYPSYDRTTGHFLQPNADIQCTNGLCTGATWRDGPPTLNLKNPPMKDTVLVPVNGYTVVRFRSDNPGHWLLHCHNDQHMNEGMALVLREAADRHPSPPEGFPRCGDFTWSSAEYQHALGGEGSQQIQTPGTDMKVTTLSIVAGVTVLAISVVVAAAVYCIMKKKGFRLHLSRNMKWEVPR
ncbi:Hypp4579 [Branchiostoma lanceolatum]|uniref:ferroxidase n=1 Tax=Branchiostoma lanceolatum TaxID=7740 RepID=A0A8K0AAA9_BRALA|nr:Hypp4579 [Branchiostoma lanceolatum]